MTALIDKLTHYHADHLFVLIGENPLPGYIAGKLLVKPDGKIYLVYSTKTKEYANSLSKVLSNSSLVPIGNAERNPDKIYELIGLTVEKLKGIIGLHYTSGTKVMSVHSYWAILEMHRDAICSYLDADRLELCFEQHNKTYGSPVKLNAKDMNVDVGLTLHQLWMLHGKQPLLKGHTEFSERTEVILPGMAPLLANHINDADWKSWIGVFKGETKLEDHEPIDKLPYHDVINLLKAYKPTIATIGDLHSTIANRSKNYLGEGGDWLEDLVLQYLQELKTELEFNDVICSARTQRAKKPSECEMELDIVAIRGYQLFIFSCYAGSNMDTCKAKLYEAAIRARQLGGSEARFALVCGHNNKLKVKEQMSGTALDQSLMVFDRNDLVDLKARIRQWIRKVDREAS
jgi:hypothetical protein